MKPCHPPSGQTSAKTPARLTRREFVGSGAALALASGIFPAILPSAVFAKPGGPSPGSRINVGVIGCGPQGRGVMGNFLGQNDCRVVAVCDLKEDQLQLARNAVNGKYGNSDCKTYHDFRELLARQDIDACLIATPDHWHVLAGIAAVEAGKDIYVEKPLARTLEEGQALRKAVRKHKRMFQFGTQQRSGRMFRLASELVRNEKIGKLRHINVWAPGSAPGGSLKQVPPPAGLDYEFWLGPAQQQPHTEDLCTDDGIKKTWWFVHNFAIGFISGWGIHPIDIAAWGGGDLLNGTVTVQGRANFRLAEGICDTATIWDIDYAFSSGVTMKFVGHPNGSNKSAPTGEPILYADEWKARYRRIEGHGTAFEGSNGWAHVDRTGVNLQPESLIELNADTFATKLTRSSNHVGNFLESVRTRCDTVCPIEAAVASDTLCHVANIAVRLGRKVKFDFKTEKFLDDDTANGMLKARPYRKPWKL